MLHQPYKRNDETGISFPTSIVFSVAHDHGYMIHIQLKIMSSRNKYKFCSLPCHTPCKYEQAQCYIIADSVLNPPNMEHI